MFWTWVAPHAHYALSLRDGTLTELPVEAAPRQLPVPSQPTILGTVEPDSPPTSSKPLKRALVTSAVVGSAVSAGHALAPGAWWWVLVHFLLPLTVFSLSAWLSGQRKPSRGLVLRGGTHPLLGDRRLPP